MDTDKLQDSILKFFDKKDRQIVFWYDVDSENESKLKEMTLPNIKIHKLTGSNNFSTKKLLESDDIQSNYLVYATFEKPEPQDNWLLDILLYSREFSVDEIANLCSEFGVYDAEIKNIFKTHLKFFKNKDRINKLKKLINGNTPKIFYTAMLATLSDCKLPDLDKIIQKFIIKILLKNEDIVQEYEKYGLADKFWQLIEDKFGYSGEPDAKQNVKKDAESLLASIIFTKLKQQLSESNFPENYKKYTRKITAENECSLFLENWLRDSELKQDYKDLAKIIEKDYKINENIKDWTEIIKNEPEFQTLEVFDKFLIEYLINSLNTLKCDYKKLLEKRKNTLFYEKYEFIYESLSWAIELNNLIKQQNIPDQRPQNFIEKYASDYFKIDKAYRKFYYYSPKTNTRQLDSVKESVEKAYVNNYLDTLSSKFSTQLSDMSPVWGMSEIDMQKDFYYNEIKKSKLKTIVIISDALRYEVAEELMQNIKGNYSIKADCDLEYMLGSVPSITKIGMAALLPHKKLTINEKGDVFADDLSTVGKENRGKILKTNCENSVVLNLSDFDDLSREDLREIFSGLEVAYVYHDKIDKTGENNEKDVFAAVQNSIDEITEKVKFIFNNTLAGNIIITADHGFLYQYSDLAEHQKIELSSVQLSEKSKRYILDNNAIKQQGVMNFEMKYLFDDSALIASIPSNINRFKTQGGGINYVHGGASLQEIVIPVLKIKQNKKQEIKKVDIVLENSRRKITNNKFTLSFLQTESISETVMPRKFKIAMFDVENDVQISNEIIIDANVKSSNMDNMKDRIFERVFELGNFKNDKNKDYYLIIRDTEEVGEPYNKIAFTIDLTFSSDFDL